MLDIAFKEWAAICRNLAEGHQSLLIRKGGIAEHGGAFHPEYSRFLLYPTYFHERQRSGLKSNLLENVDLSRPDSGKIEFSHFVEVDSIHCVADLERALALDCLHGWSSDAIRNRYHYRSPGLFVLVVRVMKLAQSCVMEERPAYAGCKSWVQLDVAIDISEAVPVLDDQAFHRNTDEILNLLGSGS